MKYIPDTMITQHASVAVSQVRNNSLETTTLCNNKLLYTSRFVTVFYVTQLHLFSSNAVAPAFNFTCSSLYEIMLSFVNIIYSGV